MLGTAEMAEGAAGHHQQQQDEQRLSHHQSQEAVSVLPLAALVVEKR